MELQKYYKWLIFLFAWFIVDWTCEISLLPYAMISIIVTLFWILIKCSSICLFSFNPPKLNCTSNIVHMILYQPEEF